MNALEQEVAKYKAELAKGPRTANLHTFTDEVIRRDIIERCKIGLYPGTYKRHLAILAAARESQQ